MSAMQAANSIAGSTMADHATALVESFDRLNTAATYAQELLQLAGFAGMRGDTADDLRVALAIHGHLVHQFNVTVRANASTATYCSCAEDAAGAAETALERQGDTPCGATVKPAEPDRVALAAAHRTMRIAMSLDAALDDPALGCALRTCARKHPVRRPTADFKSLAANDRD